MKKMIMALIALMMTISVSAQFYIYFSDGRIEKVDSISVVAPPVPTVPDVRDIDPSKCDDTTDKCWKYTISYAGASASAYTWGTEKMVVEMLRQALEDLSDPRYTITLEESPAENVDACLAKN